MTKGPETKGGRLYLVATPIGCLEDITLRALRVLQEVDLILAEDTRHSAVLLRHHGIRTRCQSFHAHSGPQAIEAAVTKLREGQALALISDAGTPLVSDPGAELVAAAIDAKIEVESLPGPSAALTALTLSGLPTPGFAFYGFLPRSGKRRREALRTIVESPVPAILYESPRRAEATLSELASLVSPERRGALCRELTKVHEDVWRGTLGELAERASDGVRGEVTLVIEAAAPAEASPAGVPANLIPLVEAMLESGVSPRDTAHRLAEAAGVPKKVAYEFVLERNRPERSEA